MRNTAEEADTYPINSVQFFALDLETDWHGDCGEFLYLIMSLGKVWELAHASSYLHVKSGAVCPQAELAH